MQQLLLLLLLLLAAGECQVGRQKLVKSLNALVSQARGDEDFDDFDYAYDFESEEQESRKGKQLPGLLPLEECETAGFERRQREECQEVPQLECNPVNVTKYRTEIVNKCKSIVDRECHVVDEQVPKEECVPSQKKVCHIAIRIEDEEVYDEVCNTIVKNICADPYHSPDKVSYPNPPPYPTSPPPPPPYPPHTPHPHPPPPPVQLHDPYKLTPTPAVPQSRHPRPYHFTPSPYPSPSPSYQTPHLPNPYLSALGRRRRHVPSPTPPGCHSVVSQDCHKVPKIVKNQVANPFLSSLYISVKVPYEKCDLVPDLDCQFVLKAIPVEECKPTVKQDCRDKAIEKPYLEEEEECFEVVYDECFLIEEQVRVVVCTRTRLDETAIFLQRGPVKRREGEKRRVKIGKRKGQQKARGQIPQGPDEDSIRINLEDLGDRLEDFLTKPINS